MAKYQTVRGMRDIFGEDGEYFFGITRAFEANAEAAGFVRISTPVLEDAELYIKGVGKGTDIVDEEMYTFKDKSGNLLALRPEGTASIVRAYLEHGMNSWPQPVRLYYIESMFRYDRPQAGRYRQHTQCGGEIFGDPSPAADAQLIALASRTVSGFGLEDFSVELNSIGDQNCRPKYIKLLKDYYLDHIQTVCPQCKVRIEQNPLRVLDCKEEQCQPVIREAPQLIDHLDKECHAHFKELLEYLDDLEVAYNLNPYLVRGLNYYTRTVFELWSEKDGAQNALASGGRYDELVKELGGKSTPGVGFGIGVDRLALTLAEAELEPPPKRPVQIYVVELGETARRASLKVLNALLNEGITAIGSGGRRGIREQLGEASKLGAPYTLIIGQKEVFDGTVIIRDMASGAQEKYSFDKIVKEVKKRLGV